MRASRFSPRFQTALWVLTAVLLVATLAFFRVNYQTRLINGDDWIVLGVSEGMAERGDLDTNWAVNPVPPEFKYPQYNFSSYNLLSHAVLSWVPRPELEIPVLRAANLLLQGLAVLVMVLALRNLRVPPIGLALCALLFAVAPGPVHDAHMLRAESLLYLLFAIVVWAATSPRPLRWRVLVAGLVIGFGAASKITFLAAGFIMTPAVLLAARRALPEGAIVALLALVASAAGFALGAPYALLNPDVYLHGMSVLNDQYSGGHPPHALIDYSPAAQAGWIAGFFALLYGPLLLIALVGLVLARPPAAILGLWLCSVATVVWSVHERTFFERNQALVVVAAALTLGWLAAYRPRLAAIVAALSLAPMLWWSWQILFETLDHNVRRTQWEMAHGLQVEKYVYAINPPPADVSQCSGVFGVRHFGDAWTDKGLAELEARGERRVARYEGRFHHVPVSTLQNFLDSDVVYFACRS